VLGAVELGETSELHRPIVERAIANYHAAAKVVKGKEIGRHSEASPVALTQFGVDHYLHEPPFVVQRLTLLLSNAHTTGRLPWNFPNELHVLNLFATDAQKVKHGVEIGHRQRHVGVLLHRGLRVKGNAKPRQREHVNVIGAVADGHGLF
jgi:hypothetical protein